MRRKTVKALIADAERRSAAEARRVADAVHPTSVSSVMDGRRVSFDLLHERLQEVERTLQNKANRIKEGDIDPTLEMIDRVLVEHDLIPRHAAEMSKSTFSHRVVDRLFPRLSVDGLPGDEIGKIAAERLAAACNVQHKEGTTAAVESLK